MIKNIKVFDLELQNKIMTNYLRRLENKDSFQELFLKFCEAHEKYKFLDEVIVDLWNFEICLEWFGEIKIYDLRDLKDVIFLDSKIYGNTLRLRFNDIKSFCGICVDILIERKT